MLFNHMSTLDIPQQATKLTTSDLKLICGGEQHQEHNFKRNKLKKHFKHDKLEKHNKKNDSTTNDNY